GFGPRVAWLLLPACAVVLLMGVTNRLCLDVASVPLLWVVPLALYLATFILCFASARQHRPRLYWTIAAISLLGYAVLDYADLGLLSRGFRLGAIADDVPILTALLFSSCMLLHGELERRKPDATELTAYYLSIAAGGALGGLFTGLLAPLIFDDYHELPLGLALSWIALGALAWRGRPLPARARRAAAALGVVAMVLLSIVPPFARAPRPCGVELLRERSFFGVSRVMECNPDQPRRHVKLLINGSTLHGRQLQLPAIRPVPTSYFGPLTAIGMALYDGPLGAEGIVLDGDGARPGRKIGIIGIGVGMIAGYGRAGDRITYYEIDPEIVAIARDSGHFDYLAHSRAEIEIVLGDARLSLERELARTGAREFDVLVVDAFSSDAIPTHLLTREAFALYARHLERDGLLAVHVSNRYLRLAPLVARVGASQGFSVLQVQNRSFAGYSSGKALWVLLSTDAQLLEQLEQKMRARIRDLGVRERTIAIERIRDADLVAAPLWTDDYSNILSVLRFAPQAPRGSS
ncbi:MAG TPA: fused MFS/spermidine synthase, partial [Myxococcota bacterium]|nr:fused MFS/spermidine synthase [Myxococcota bacterium]